VPNVGDNGMHASASPFEALAERSNWLGADVGSDPFGKALINAGTCLPFHHLATRIAVASGTLRCRWQLVKRAKRVKPKPLR
jgi:hypothetical protein